MHQDRFRIVLVEDNPADAEILRIALAREDATIEITHLKAGAEAMDHLGAASVVPDLIILDLNLPEISGFDVLERIRSTDHLKSIPIVVMSGSGNPEEIGRCRRLGATSYIQKPSQLPEVFGVAQQLVTLLRSRADGSRRAAC